MAAELLTRYFLSEISPQLFPDNTFASRARNDDAFVRHNSVELAHSGTLPLVEVERTILPATIAKRTDVPTQYFLDELTSDPTLIQDSEEMETNYNKRASVLDQHVKAINDKGYSRLLYAWASGGSDPAVDGVVTTGADRPATAPAATGVRAGLEVRNILQAMEMLDRQNVPSNGRSIILPAAMHADLFKLEDYHDASKYGTATVPGGSIGRLYGMDVYMRSVVTIYDAAFALAPEGAAGAATDNLGAMVWHEDFTRRAAGSVKVYIDNDKPEYYGSVFSAMARFGGIAAFNGARGIVNISEGPGTV